MEDNCLNYPLITLYMLPALLNIKTSQLEYDDLSRRFN